MKKKRKLAIYGFFLALIVLYIVIYAVPSVTGALTKTEILQYKSFRTTDEAVCYLVRNEKVYTAAGSGEINYYIEDGIQLRKNSRVLAVSPKRYEETESAYGDLVTKLGQSAVSKQDYTTEFNGIVSYYIDGYEGMFSPETMRELEYDKIKNLDIKPVNLTRTSTLAGEPMYKICDNSKWYLLCWVKPVNVSKYSVDSIVTVNLPLGEIKANTVDIIDKGDMWLVILESNRFYADFGKTRMAEATIITSEYNGIVVKNQSLATSDGQVGVYVRDKSGEYTFTPVKIITSEGDETLVEDTIFYDNEKKQVKTVKIYDEILKNPDQK